MQNDHPKARALIWANTETALNGLLTEKDHGKSVFQTVLESVSIPQIEKIGLIASSQIKALLEPMVGNKINWLLQEDNNSFAQSILLADDWFHDFDGSVLLLTADLPFVNPESIRRLLDCMQNDQAVGCLLTAQASQVQKSQAQVIRNADGAVRRLEIIVHSSNKTDKPVEITGFPFIFDWDCLQRALYQVLHNRQNADLFDIVEKAKDNGFDVKDIPIGKSVSFYRIFNENDLSFATKITKESS